MVNSQYLKFGFNSRFWLIMSISVKDLESFKRCTTISEFFDFVLRYCLYCDLNHNEDYWGRSAQKWQNRIDFWKLWARNEHKSLNGSRRSNWRHKVFAFYSSQNNLNIWIQFGVHCTAFTCTQVISKISGVNFWIKFQTHTP